MREITYNWIIYSYTWMVKPSVGINFLKTLNISIYKYCKCNRTLMSARVWPIMMGILSLTVIYMVECYFLRIQMWIWGCVCLTRWMIFVFVKVFFFLILNFSGHRTRYMWDLVEEEFNYHKHTMTHDLIYLQWSCGMDPKSETSL